MAEPTLRSDVTQVAVAPAGPLAGPRALPARAAYALAAVAGLLYYLAFPGVGLWPLSFVALAPLVVALDGQTPRRALLIGGVTGFALNVGGFYWLFGMLRTFSGFPAPICAVFAVILWLYQGGRLALLGWLHARATARGWPRGPVFLLAFAATELLWPLLFPWYFGASALPAPAFTQVAEIGGPYLIGWVLVAPSVALAELWLARRGRGRASRWTVALGLAIPVLAGAWGAVRLRQIDARALASPPLHVGLAQGNMPLVQTRGDFDEGLRRHREMTEQLRRRGAELVVWSEATLARSLPEQGYQTALEHLFTRELKVPTIFGAVLYKRDQHGHAVAFNTALLANGAGAITGRYDKQYLLAFGEYLPFGDLLPVLYDWSPNSGHLSAGRSFDPLLVGDHRVTALICYEDILPSFVNAAVRHARPDLLVNLTNDAWFGDTTEPWEHLALAQLRSIEHRRYLVRATNSGVSAVVDPVGRLIAHGAVFQQDTVDAVVHWMSGDATVYETIGDAPWWLAAAAVAAMAFRRRSALT